MNLSRFSINIIKENQILSIIKNMKKLLIGVLILSLFIITGCTKITISNTDDSDNWWVCGINPDTSCDEIIETGAIEQEPIQIDMTDKTQVIIFALQALKENNINNLIEVISKNWVRFSPYSYIDIDKHIVLKKENIEEAFNSEVKYVRGSEDGTGDPIILSFKDYLKKYIYDIDFATIAERNENNTLQRGNMINNIEDIYTGASTIEFFVPGINPEYEGMDRRSLTLVLQQENWERKVRAIVHSQWTI